MSIWPKEAAAFHLISSIGLWHLDQGQIDINFGFYIYWSSLHLECQHLKLPTMYFNAEFKSAEN